VRQLGAWRVVGFQLATAVEANQCQQDAGVTRGGTATFVTLSDLTGTIVSPKLKGENMANPFVHVELNTTDPIKAKEFYGQLFDWKLEDVPMGPDMTYTMIKVGEGTGGGMMKHPVPGAPSTWLAYVAVDDVKASTDKARSLGATIVRDVTEIPGVGSFSILVDPTGAHLALWKPAA
jgi:uncharacterized protein